MPSPTRRHPDLSLAALRASLLGPVDTGLEDDSGLGLRPAHAEDGAAITPPPAATLVPRAEARVAVVPTAEEVLVASPAVVRLCESYHRAFTSMVQRTRRQRIGILCLVGGLGIGAMVLSRSGTLTSVVVTDLVLAAAGSSTASLALLALLWKRDQRSLRALQGPRLLRALHAHCSLPPDRLAMLRRNAQPVVIFFDCYAVWRTRRQKTSPLRRLVAAFRGTNHPRPAAS